MDTTTNTRKPLSIWKHLAIIWLGGIIVWPAFTGLVTFAALPPEDAFVLTLIVALMNIFTGWAPALFVFVMHWGIRGWIETVHQFNETRDAHAASQAHVENHLEAQQPVTEEQMLAEWAQMNTVGCCMNHRDAQGYPSHGGPDCRHPEVVGHVHG